MNTQDKNYPATVIKILDNYKVVINRGASHGICPEQRFLIYSLSEEEITDPESGESLGRLEIVKGIGKVIHVQEKMSIIESDKKKLTRRKIIKKPAPIFRSISLFAPEIEEIIEPEEIEPFENVKVGDKAKPI